MRGKFKLKNKKFIIIFGHPFVEKTSKATISKALFIEWMICLVYPQTAPTFKSTANYIPEKKNS